MDKIMPWAVGILFTLILGAFGFARSSALDVEDRATRRIERMEDRMNQKLDEILKELRR